MGVHRKVFSNWLKLSCLSHIDSRSQPPRGLPPIVHDESPGVPRRLVRPIRLAVCTNSQSRSSDRGLVADTILVRGGVSLVSAELELGRASSGRSCLLAWRPSSALDGSVSVVASAPASASVPVPPSDRIDRGHTGAVDPVGTVVVVDTDSGSGTSADGGVGFGGYRIEVVVLVDSVNSYSKPSHNLVLRLRLAPDLGPLSMTALHDVLAI